MTPGQSRSRPLGGLGYIALVQGALLVACSGGRAMPDASDSGDAAVAWQCPPSWERTRGGGCGPAILVCGSSRQAPGACAGFDPQRVPSVALADGGTVQGWHRAADGSLRGAWHDPGEPGGPPSRDWRPDAGIPSCPTQWRRRTDGTCDPLLPTSCPVGAARLPGGRCTLTSEIECGTDRFPDPGAEAVGATIVHVARDADPVMADGSRARPFLTVTAGVRAAGPDGWVLVADGDYREAVLLAGRVHLVGVCAARVRIVGTVAAAAISAFRAGDDVHIRAVTLSGDGKGVDIESGAHATIRDSRIDAANGYGAYVHGAGSRLTIDGVDVSGTRRSSAGAGRGIFATQGASIDATRLSADGNAESDLRIDQNTGAVSVQDSHFGPRSPNNVRATRIGTLRLIRSVLSGSVALAVSAASDALVEDIVASPPPSATPGAGAIGAGGTSVTLRRIQADDTRVRLDGPTIGAVLLEDSILRDTRPTDQPDGYQALTLGGANIVVQRVLFDQQGVAAVTQFSGAGTVRDCRIVGGRVEADPFITNSSAVLVQNGTLRVERIRIDNWVGRAVSAVVISSSGERFAQPVITISDSVIAGTRRHPQAQNNGMAAESLVAEAGGELRVARVLVVDGDGTAILSTWDGDFGVPSRIVVEDSVVLMPFPVPSLTLHAAAAVVGRAALTVRRMYAEGVLGYGFVAWGDGASADLEDVTVHHSSASTAAVSPGVAAARGGRVSARRVVVIDAQASALAAFDTGSVLAVDDVLALETAAGPNRFGVAMAAFSGARMSGSRWAVSDAVGAGIAAVPLLGIDGNPADGSRLSASDVFVADVHSGRVTIDSISRVVSYATHAGQRSSVELERATLLDSGYGFFSAGLYALRSAVIGRQLDSAGAFRTTGLGAALTLENVARFENATDVLSDGAELPEAALATPTPVCVGGRC